MKIIVAHCANTWILLLG